MKNKRKNWWQVHWEDILATSVPALITLAASIVQLSFGREGGSFKLDWTLLNYGMQTLFIVITLFVLIRCWSKVRRDVEQEGAIKRYLRVYCLLPDEGDRALALSYSVVSGTVRQFFWAWSAIWVLWLAYYCGSLIEYSYSLSLSEECWKGFCYCFGMRNMATYQNTLNFLSSAFLYAIYLILNEATVKPEERHQTKNILLHGLIIIAVLALLFFVPTMIAQTACPARYNGIMLYVSLLLSIFSTVTFTLILGKLNSPYLQFPGWMISGLYIYAVVQAYEPLTTIYASYFDLLIENDKLCGLSCMVDLVQKVLPWITLAGKMLLMLALLWISDGRRLVSYIIHQSLSLTEAPRMQKRLDQHLS